MKHFFTLVCLLIFSISIGAQDNTEKQPTTSINEGTIADQFEFVIKKSSNWRDEKGQSYEVIKRNLMITLKEHTLDSIKAFQKRLDDTNKIVNTQQNEINDLKSNLTTTQSTLDATNIEKDSMSLLGLQLSKTSYNVLMWSIIAALLAFLLMFIFRFKNSNVITKAAKKALAETEEEFEEHRRNALEREQKVRRQLQDEINKQKGI
ncbi:tRNA (guanine-N1)-methyltransferase [Flavobacteriaceae bacterium AU392]|nr:tRNA (guanine-N1)-methyltransferase [Flavobacteriaceae bacterium]RKM86130.1 tRNA (guanine-N1)-methyltransferase [Flavobacteriaceae bacterium AU392]